jgi:anti-anti-sigma factor
MLRIARTGTEQTTTTLKLEGQVRGQWVEELRLACDDALDRRPESLVLDLADVSFIDTAGLDLFRELASRGIVFHNCSLFAAEQLKAVANGR